MLLNQAVLCQTPHNSSIKCQQGVCRIKFPVEYCLKTLHICYLYIVTVQGKNYWIKQKTYNSIIDIGLVVCFPDRPIIHTKQDSFSPSIQTQDSYYNQRYGQGLQYNIQEGYGEGACCCWMHHNSYDDISCYIVTNKQ